jgi:methionyl-tRNA formyltransferase
MQMVEALDAGDMLAKAVRPIGPDETTVDVERALAQEGGRLLLDVIERLEAGTIRAEPQDESASTYAPRLRKEEGLIDWTQSARRIHDRVRGLYPWPHAYSYLDGTRLIVLKTTVGLKPDTIGGSASVAPDSAEPAPPGSVAGITRDAIEVATGDGRIAITELQSEGKRPMTAREFLAGRAVRPGMTFESPRP